MLYLLISHILNIIILLNTSIQGAWQLKGAGDPGEISTMIITNNYMVVAVYNENDHNFIRSYSGSIKIISKEGEPDLTPGKGQQLIMKLEFDTKDTSIIGSDFTYAYTVNCNLLTLKNTDSVVWTRLDIGTSAMSGCWRITSRAGNDGNMTKMPDGPRKTLKLISDTRFQWVAINPITKQFSGTGGGTYTLKDGKYNEHIEFFSRDKSRAGSSLSFDAKLEGIHWDHSGTSSTGNPVHEIWAKQ